MSGPAASWRLALPATQEHPDWAAAEVEAFRTDLIGAIAEVVIPAFVRYLEVLEQEILPVARPSDRAGLVHVPGGEDAYRALARSHTGLDIDPRAVHDLGLREIERIDEAFSDLGARVLGVHGLEATLAALQSDPRTPLRRCR